MLEVLRYKQNFNSRQTAFLTLSNVSELSGTTPFVTLLSLTCMHMHARIITQTITDFSIDDILLIETICIKNYECTQTKSDFTTQSSQQTPLSTYVSRGPIVKIHNINTRDGPIAQCQYVTDTALTKYRNTERMDN